MKWTWVFTETICKLNLVTYLLPIFYYLTLVDFLGESNCGQAVLNCFVTVDGTDCFHMPGQTWHLEKYTLEPTRE